MLPYMWIRAILLFVIAASALVADNKSALLKKMYARAQHYGEVSRKIWEFAKSATRKTRAPIC